MVESAYKTLGCKQWRWGLREELGEGTPLLIRQEDGVHGACPLRCQTHAGSYKTPQEGSGAREPGTDIRGKPDERSRKQLRVSGGAPHHELQPIAPMPLREAESVASAPLCYKQGLQGSGRWWHLSLSHELCVPDVLTRESSVLPPLWPEGMSCRGPPSGRLCSEFPSCAEPAAVPRISNSRGS